MKVKKSKKQTRYQVADTKLTIPTSEKILLSTRHFERIEQIRLLTCERKWIDLNQFDMEKKRRKIFAMESDGGFQIKTL